MLSNNLRERISVAAAIMTHQMKYFISLKTNIIIHSTDPLSPGWSSIDFDVTEGGSRSDSRVEPDNISTSLHTCEDVCTS